jgi:membrane-associated phospholipid phosphatase
MQKNLSPFVSDFTKEVKNCTWFFGGLIILVIASAVLLLAAGKTGSFISLNGYHPFIMNVFFINYTFVGDGIFAFCLIGFCFYQKKRQTAITLLVSFLLSGIIVQVIKNAVIAPRPKVFFEPGQYLYFIDSISRTGFSSFPSGHTATAFAIATVLVLMIKNKKWQLQVLIAAALVGYSRIYLAQHFLIDVIIGAAIGSLTGIASLYLVLNINGIRQTIAKWQGKKIKDEEQPSSTIQTA